MLFNVASPWVWDSCQLDCLLQVILVISSDRYYVSLSD